MSRMYSPPNQSSLSIGKRAPPDCTRSKEKRSTSSSRDIRTVLSSKLQPTSASQFTNDSTG